MDNSKCTRGINIVLSVPKYTANMYCICLSACFMFANVRYIFAVNFGTLRITQYFIDLVVPFDVRRHNSYNLTTIKAAALRSKLLTG